MPDHPGAGGFPDFVPSGNLAVDPALYEAENEAIARDGRLDAALREVADWTGRSLAGSAEHLPLPDGTFDVVHARFAYFFGAGAEAGLAEVRRVLAQGGTFVAVDNDWDWGDLAVLLRAAARGNAALDPAATTRWWRAAGARRIAVRAGWHARSSDELEALLRPEFPDEVVDTYLAQRRPSDRITYGVALHVVDTPGGADPADLTSERSSPPPKGR